MEGRSEQTKPKEDEEQSLMLNEVDLHCPFGPLFFLHQLRGLVRDRCPDPEERMPVVELRLTDGEVLDICHVMGVAPTWVALAVNELDHVHGDPAMRTELVPYAIISRVTVRAGRHGTGHLGFETGAAASIIARPAASQPLTPQLIRHADIIWTMTRSHRQAILSQWPEAASRTEVLAVDESDVPDPIGGPLEYYEQCAKQIKKLLAERVAKIEL